MKDILKLLYQYEDDKIHGRPIWQDRTFWGLVIGFLATIFAKYMQVNIDAEMQAAIVVLIAGIAHLTQSHVGMRRVNPDKQVFVVQPQEAAKNDASASEQHNLTSLSCIALLLVMLMPLMAMAAGPYLVTSPVAGADYFVVNGLPSTISASNCTPDPAGTYGLKLDVSGLTPGSYSVTTEACSNTWGCSSATGPFAFTRPNLSSAPAGLGLAVK